MNVGDVDLFKNIEAPKGRGVDVFTGERFGCHPNPKNDRGGGLSDHTDANDVGACPLDPHLIQTMGATLSSQMVLSLWDVAICSAQIPIPEKVPLQECSFIVRLI